MMDTDNSTSGFEREVCVMLNRSLRCLIFGVLLFCAPRTFAALSYLHDAASWCSSQIQQVETTAADDEMAGKRIFSFKKEVSNRNGDVAMFGSFVIRKSVRVLNFVHGLWPSSWWFWFRDVLSAAIIIACGYWMLRLMAFCLNLTRSMVNPEMFTWGCALPGIIPVIASFWKIAPVVDDVLLVFECFLLSIPIIFLGLNIYWKGGVYSWLLMVVFAPLCLSIGLVAAGVGAYLFWYAVVGIIILVGIFCFSGTGDRRQKGDRAVLDDGTRIEYDGNGEWRDRDNSSRKFEETSSDSFREK